MIPSHISAAELFLIIWAVGLLACGLFLVLSYVWYYIQLYRLRKPGESFRDWWKWANFKER